VTDSDADAAAVADEAHPSAKPRRLLLFGLVAGAALVIDIVSKVIVAANLGDHAPVRLLGGAIYLVETRNSGAAFSTGTGATVVLTVIALAVAAIILRTARRLHSIGWAVALGLILGGALGNIVDRLFRAPGVGRGHVVDWISPFSDDGSRFAIFNLADSAITCGAVLAAILALRGLDLDGRRGPRGR
jgi:signal peptidase II